MGKTIPSNNFGGLPKHYSSYRNSKIVILPVPFDKTTTWIKGASKGPQAIINASLNMELYDIETGSEIYTKGIHTAGYITAVKPEAMINNVYKKTVKFLTDKKYTVVLGGEHTVSLGSIKAHAEHFDNLSILHLDAHADMRDSYDGTGYSHACVMARAREITDRIISVGIRSMDASELKHINKRKMFYASDVRKSRTWIKNVVEKLNNNVYVTIDLDVFDPSIMPSTGTPEPGGLDWYDVLDLLEAVSKKSNIIGFDIVELCPSKNIAPDFLAAKLIYKLLSLKFA
ncbi:MAG: agmatinase [Nitrospiraceae bacterium]|nr:MAG: agmatinase [Nitrospiraceae bacterium]